MRNKFFLVLILALSFGLSNASAQITGSAPTKLPPIEGKAISSGVLNGKATSLPKPPYPAAAKAVGASGAVNVQVVLDETGNVISAAAISGHPLLQQAAVQAAQQSKFNSTVLNGQAVKVTGVIVYNFVAPEQSMNWLKIGYDLASVQHASLLIHLNTNVIDKVFQADWTTEREQLKKLEEIKQAESSKVSLPAASAQRQISDTTEKKADGTVVRKVVTEFAVKNDTDPNSEQVAISQSLISSLQSRLGGDELNLWRLNTGVSLSLALSKLRFTSERQRVLDSLRSQIQSAPSGISADYITALQKILTVLEKPNPTADDRNEISPNLQRLFRN
jgi:TonB family protein